MGPGQPQSGGPGRVERLKDQSEELGAGVIVIDAALSPVQQRNLENAWNAKVIDRTGLILEIDRKSVV